MAMSMFISMAFAFTHKGGVLRDTSWRLRGGGGGGTWDYVIVGGGAGGCVLAERLSADPENRVMLLEAGTDGSCDMRIRIPAALVKVFKSDRDWDFETEPVQGTNRGVYLCRGKVLGGSSSTNVMLYHRGTPADYDSWVQKGAIGWGPAEVLDYFRRAENNIDGASQYHGTGGPMPVDHVPYINELSKAFCEAAGALGYRRNLDFNDWSAPQDGFGRFKVTQHSGERCSAHNAYLQGNAAKRVNLKVATGAHVTKVSLEGGEHDLCASGVEYMDSDGVSTRAQLAAGGEVRHNTRNLGTRLRLPRDRQEATFAEILNRHASVLLAGDGGGACSGAALRRSCAVTSAPYAIGAWPARASW